MEDVRNAVLVHREDVSPGLAIFRIAPDGWPLPAFVAGQFAVLGLPGSAPRLAGCDAEDPPPDPAALIRRSYSVASSSRQHEYLEVYVTLVRSGALTPRLFALRPGDRVWLGPRVAGVFTLREVPPDRDLVLVATGTGLAPYVSMLRSELELEGPRRIAVLLGARHSSDLGYRDELTELARRFPAFSYIPTISRPDAEPVPWTGATGYVQALWTGGAVEAAFGRRPRPDDTHVFLCGNPAMIASMIGILVGEGFREHTRRHPGEVHAEKYWSEP